MLSVILPSYNEEKMIAKATARMAEILQPEKIDYELLFIDDGSRDGTWAQINEAAEKDSHVVGGRTLQPQLRQGGRDVRGAGAGEGRLLRRHRL